MITNTGKSIISKYLVGQAPTYASYIAVGCGAKPLNNTANISAIADSQNLRAKKFLDFEMFRVPVVSSGIVTESGNTQIVLTGELPTNDRYEITEIGLYTSGSNPIIAESDSRTIYTFGVSENWEYHTNVSSNTVSYSNVTPFANVNIVNPGHPVSFRLNATDTIFENEDRISRNERPRFLDNTVIVRGSMSDISIDGVTGEFLPNSGSSHIHLAGKSVALDTNTSEDKLLLAFSIIQKETSMPDATDLKIMIEFTYSETANIVSDYAKMQVHLESADLADSYKYYVVSQKLGDLFKTDKFSWSKAIVGKVFVDITPGSGQAAEDYYVAIDALRFENISALDLNPLYGMTAYSPIKNENPEVAGYGVPITKESNSVNLVEFRFGLGT